MAITLTNFICPSTKRLRLPFKPSGKIAVVDGDLLVFRACVTAAQKLDLTEDDKPLEEARRVETVNAEQARTYFRDNLANAVRGNEFCVVCLSHHTNWRKRMFPVYKANRTGEKPLGLGPMRRWVMENYYSLVMPELEADDLLGLLSTHPEFGERTVIISDDKDMQTLPGLHRKLSNLSETTIVARWEAELQHLYQTLVGDACDGYKGAVGVGPKKAEAMLAPFREAGAGFDREKAWGVVEKAFLKAGQDQQDALDNARMAKILWWDEVTFNADCDPEIRLFRQDKQVCGESGVGEVQSGVRCVRADEGSTGF